MKNSDEMVKSLFERRAQYDVKQKQKKKFFLTATSLSCVCLAVLLGFGIWKVGMFNTTQPNQEIDYPGVKDTSDTSKSSENPVEKNKIVIRQIDGISGDGNRKLNFNLRSEDFVEMDKSSLIEYYGTNLFPGVPADLKEWQDSHGIYRENGGTGNVYYDGTILNYSNEDFSRSINIEIDKDAMPITDCAFFNEIEEKSIINNTEVAIAKTDDGYYYAQFMYHNVGFQIIGEGLTENEFVDVISSLIQ